MDRQRNNPQREPENESEIEADLMKRMNELDQKLLMFQQNDVTKPKSEKELEKEKQKKLVDLNELPVINRKGEKVKTIEDVRNNYNNAPPLLNRLQLPFCYSSVMGKVKFWIFGGAAVAFTWEYKNIIESKQKLRDMTFKSFSKRYAMVTFAAIALSVAESYLFDDYCDISSYHYNEGIDRKARIQRLKNINVEGPQKF